MTFADEVQLPHRLGWSFQFRHPVERVWPFEWIEHPYEWIQHKVMSVEREYSRGLFRRLHLRWELRPEGEGCVVDHQAAFAARSALVAPAVRFVMANVVGRAFLRAYEQLDAYLTQTPYVPLSATWRAHRTDAPPIRDLTQRVVSAGAATAIAERLALQLLGGSPYDAARMRPFALARAWGFDGRETLVAFLRAARAGVLEVSWDLMCPSCGGDKEKVATLRELPGQAHCASCNIRYDATFDDSVELTFSAAPAVREDLAGRFCVGGPQNTPQSLAQQRLAPGASRVIDVHLPPGVYVVRSLQSASRLVLEVEEGAGGPPELRVSFVEGGAEQRERRGPGLMRLRVDNRCGWEVVAVLQRATWLEDVCTASYVTMLQEFRDMFSSEVLRPGQEIAVRSVSLLFTDLKGSTSMYARVGDAAAFSLVRDHFDLLLDCVRRHDGAIVKTIGDAIMAVFGRPSDAVQAALEMHHALLAQGEGGSEPLILKVGVHTGPCYAVNLNDRLDYFGTNVNIAARTEGLCSGNDIVMTRQVYESPGVRELLEGSARRVEQLSRALKGLEGDFTLYRIDCAEEVTRGGSDRGR